jgi:hypothetical protein
VIEGTHLGGAVEWKSSINGASFFNSTYTTSSSLDFSTEGSNESLTYAGAYTRTGGTEIIGFAGVTCCSDIEGNNFTATIAAGSASALFVEFDSSGECGVQT